MQYLFSVTGNDKAAIETQVSTELDKIVEAEAHHADERAITGDAFSSLIKLVREPQGNEEITATVTGTMSVDEGSTDVFAASLMVTIAILAKPLDID